jgi:dipeptidase E
MKILLLSTSTVHGKPYLEYCNELLESFYINIKELLFVPFAKPSGISEDDYTQKVAERFAMLNIKTTGIHHYDDKKSAIQNSEAIFIGGGNTFLLLNELYKYNLLDLIKSQVLSSGTLYMGTSAGSNVAGLTINTTNDMPIIYPPSFNSIGLVNFNLNPHYLDPDPNSTHKGETRQTRINEFHSIDDNKQIVLGLREGSGLLIEGKNTPKITLTGDLSMRVFEQNKKPYELTNKDDLSFLINN